jgi:hypothetical protein
VEYAVSDLENRRKKIVGEPDEGEPHVRFDVAGDGQPGYGNGTEALSEEMERNGSALPTFLAPSPDPTNYIIAQMFSLRKTSSNLMRGEKPKEIRGLIEVLWWDRAFA